MKLMRSIFVLLTAFLLVSPLHAADYYGRLNGWDLRSSCTSVTKEGVGCYNTSTHVFCIGNGTSCAAVPPADGTFTTITVPTIYGSTSASGDLRLQSTTNAIKGKVYFGAGTDKYFDETTGELTSKKIGGIINAAQYDTLQAAADAAGVGGHLYIPTGTYTSGIMLTSVHDAITIEGAGYGTYIHVATGHGISATGTAETPLKGINIKNLRVTQDEVRDGWEDHKAAIYFKYVDRSVIENTIHENSGDSSIYLYSSNYNKIVNPRIHNSNIHSDGASGTMYEIIVDQVSHGNSIINPTLIWQGDISGPRYGMLIGNNSQNQRGTSVVGGMIDKYYIGIQTSTAPGTAVQGATFSNTIIGIWNDSGGVQILGNSFITNQRGIDMTGGGWATIVGNYFQGNTEANIRLQDTYSNQIGENFVLDGGNIVDDVGYHDKLGVALEKGVLKTIISSGTIVGGGGHPDAKNTFHDSAVSFSTVQAGDILYSPTLFPNYRRVIGVLDSTHITVDIAFTDTIDAGHPYRIMRYTTVLDDRGNLRLAQHSFVDGGVRHPEYVISTATSSGSISAINSTPTAGGTGYATNDLVTVIIGSMDALIKVTGVTGGVVDTIELVDSGSYDYTTGTGKATSKLTGSGTGLTVEITTVGLTPAQVSNTILTNTGQGAADITNYLPTAKSGYKFKAQMVTPQTNHSWGLANNSGTANNASGDVMALAGTDGTAGAAHGIKDGSGASNITKGDALECWTANIDATNGYYQWFCIAPVAGAWAAY